MKHYILSFIKLPTFWIMLSLMLVLPIFNILQNLEYSFKTNYTTLTNFNFFNTPYYHWIAGDDSSGRDVLFFFLLPLFVSIPATSMLISNQKSGYHYYARYRLQTRKYYNSFLSVALLIGAVVPFLVLLFNFLALFLVWPNILPLASAFSDMGRDGTTFMFPALFFNHPFWAVMVNILLISLYGSLYAVISITFSLFISHTFICILIPFALQLLIGLIASVYPLTSITPAEFLCLSVNTIRPSPMYLFLIPLVLILICCFIYRKRVHNYV